jgi:hypothetical protein
MRTRRLSKFKLALAAVCGALLGTMSMRVEIPPDPPAPEPVLLPPPRPWDEIRAERYALCLEHTEEMAATCEVAQTASACQAWMDQTWRCEQWRPKP